MFGPLPVAVASVSSEKALEDGDGEDGDGGAATLDPVAPNNDVLLKRTTPPGPGRGSEPEPDVGILDVATTNLAGVPVRSTLGIAGDESVRCMEKYMGPAVKRRKPGLGTQAGE